MYLLIKIPDSAKAEIPKNKVVSQLSDIDIINIRTVVKTRENELKELIEAEFHPAECKRDQTKFANIHNKLMI